MIPLCILTCRWRLQAWWERKWTRGRVSAVFFYACAFIIIIVIILLVFFTLFIVVYCHKHHYHLYNFYNHYRLLSSSYLFIIIFVYHHYHYRQLSSPLLLSSLYFTISVPSSQYTQAHIKFLSASALTRSPSISLLLLRPDHSMHLLFLMLNVAAPTIWNVLPASIWFFSNSFHILCGPLNLYVYA